MNNFFCKTNNSFRTIKFNFPAYLGAAYNSGRFAFDYCMMFYMMKIRVYASAFLPIVRFARTNLPLTSPAQPNAPSQFTQHTSLFDEFITQLLHPRKKITIFVLLVLL
jgi:hypothetical protein